MSGPDTNENLARVAAHFPAFASRMAVANGEEAPGEDVGNPEEFFRGRATPLQPAQPVDAGDRPTRGPVPHTPPVPRDPDLRDFVVDVRGSIRTRVYQTELRNGSFTATIDMSGFIDADGDVDEEGIGEAIQEAVNDECQVSELSRYIDTEDSEDEGFDAELEVNEYDLETSIHDVAEEFREYWETRQGDE